MGSLADGAVAKADGSGFDLADNKLLYRTPVTRIENVEEPFAVDKALRRLHPCCKSSMVRRENSKSLAMPS
jgi:hypothetical protein